MAHAVSSKCRQLCDEIKRFIDKEVEPRSRWIEEHDEIPADLVQKARELGLFGLTIPEQYGGSGLDLAGKCAVEEEMGKTNYGFATLIGNHTGISTTGIVALGNDAQKQKYLPRMAAGEWIGCFALTEAAGGFRPERDAHHARSRRATATSSTAKRSSSPTRRSRACSR